MFKSEKQKIEEEGAWIRREKWEYIVVFSVMGATFLLLAAAFMPWDTQAPDFGLMLALTAVFLFGVGWVVYFGTVIWKAYTEWEKSVR